MGGPLTVTVDCRPKEPPKCNSFGGFLFAAASRNAACKEMSAAAKRIAAAAASRHAVCKEMSAATKRMSAAAASRNAACKEMCAAAKRIGGPFTVDR